MRGSWPAHVPPGHRTPGPAHRRGRDARAACQVQNVGAGLCALGPTARRREEGAHWRDMRERTLGSPGSAREVQGREWTSGGREGGVAGVATRSVVGAAEREMAERERESK
jgi:hypothetical protein